MIHFNYYIQAHHEPSFVVEPAMKMLYANPLQAGSKSRLERIRRGVVDDGGGIVIGERLRRQFPGSVARKRAPLLELRRTVGVFLARGLADVRQHLLFATKSGDELAQLSPRDEYRKKMHRSTSSEYLGAWRAACAHGIVRATSRAFQDH
jgi:hypothetical protein